MIVKSVKFPEKENFQIFLNYKIVNLEKNYSSCWTDGKVSFYGLQLKSVIKTDEVLN